MKRTKLLWQYVVISCCVAAVLIAENVMFLRELSAPNPHLGQIRILMWVFTVLTVGVVIFAGHVSAGLIAKRVSRLLRAIEEVREGKFPRLRVQGNDEMTALMRGFNETVEEIRIRDEKIRGIADQRKTQVIELSRTLEEERKHFGGLLDSIDDAFLVLDSANRVVMANRRVSEILGMPMQILQSANLGTVIEQVRHRLVPLETVDDNLRELQDAAERISETVLRLDSADGETIRLYRTPLKGDDSELLGRIAALLDASKTRALDLLKSEFISTISHELRTPLTSMKAGFGLIRTGATGAVPIEMRELLDVAVNNTDRLIRVVNQFLDLSQLERGQAQMRRASVSISGCVARAWKAVASLAEVRGMVLDSRISADTPPVFADANRVEQVLVNLFSNAIKFSARGQPIVVTAEAEGSEVLVAVQDHGRGMSQEFQTRLFRKFEHAEGALRRDSQGIGLGLAICRQIIDAHGGRIWVQSAENQGSTFRFSLPSAAHSSAAGRLVLIVDEDPDLARVLARAFESQGHRVLCAHDDREASELAANDRPDILVVDVVSGDEDEDTVTRALRSDRIFGGIPMICISAVGDSGWPAGADFYLEKPLDINKLRHVTEQALAKIAKKTN